MRQFSLLLSLLLLITSCGPSKKAQQDKLKEVMDSWLGHHKSELIQSWGPPDRYASDGKDGEILIYEKMITRGAVIYNTYREVTTSAYKMVYVDRNGKIYFWRTKG
jgi:hypothetical protein